MMMRTLCILYFLAKYDYGLKMNSIFNKIIQVLKLFYNYIPEYRKDYK